MSDKIKSSDIIDDELFVKVNQNGEVFIKTIREITEGLKETLIASQRIMATTVFGDSASIEKYTKEAEKAEKLKAMITKGEILSEKLRQESIKTQSAHNRETEKATKLQEKATKEAQKASKAQADLNSEYKQATITLAAMEKKLLDMAVSGRQATAEDIKLIKAHDELRKKIVSAEESIGRYNRNVGNYKSGFDGLGMSINQLTREMPAFANSVQTGFMAISNNLPIFFDEIQKTQAAIKQLRAEGQQVPNLFSQLTTAIFSWGTALSVGVTLLTVYGKEIGEFVSSLFTLNDAYQISGKAQSAYYTEARKLIEKQLDAQIKLNVAKGIWTKQQGEEFKLQYEKNKQVLDAQIAFEEEKKAIQEKYNSGGIKNELFGVNIQEAQKAYLEAEKRFIDQKERINKAATIEQLANDEDARKEKLKKEKETALLLDQNIQDEFERRRKITLDAYKYDILLAGTDAEEKRQIEIKKNQDLLKIEEDYQKKLREMRTDNITDEDEQEKQRLYDEFEDTKKRYGKTGSIIAEARIKLQNGLNKLAENKRKKEFDAEQKAADDGEKRSKTRVANIQKQEDDMDAAYSKRLSDLAIKNGENLVKEQNEKAEARKEELKEARKQADALLNIYDQLSKAKADRLERELNYDIDKRQRNILQQQQLAANGLDNTLAYEKEALAKDELAKQEQARKRERNAKILAFLKLIDAFADKGDKDAVTKAFVQMAIATAISGSFAEGVENLEGPGTETSDSILARLSKGESVATARATRDNPGMVTAMNKGKVDEYFEKEYLPKYMVSHDVGSFAENTVASILIKQYAEMSSEMKSIKQELKNRPVQQISLNSLGEVIDTKITNGIKRTTTRKNNSPLNYL